MNDPIVQIREEVEQLLSGGKGSHDLDHTLRVYRLCLHIGKKEKANQTILKLAALLHDIGRLEEDTSKGKICHATRGAVIAETILKKYGYEEKVISEVVHCIVSHRFRGKNIPESNEAKILFDADKLDSIGAVGVGRAFLFAGEQGAKLHNDDVDVLLTQEYSIEDTAYREFMVKLRHVKDRMLTEEGKFLAQERHEFMMEFFHRLKKETKGEL